MSAIMDRGIVRLSASVPINDEVRKQPLKKKERNKIYIAILKQQKNQRKTMTKNYLSSRGVLP